MAKSDKDAKTAKQGTAGKAAPKALSKTTALRAAGQPASAGKSASKISTPAAAAPAGKAASRPPTVGGSKPAQRGIAKIDTSSSTT
ncbi:MAG: hypothetical protein KAZ24_02940, partial [Brachymonas sp.]|nr:hypothetical protein [Brachymonas sp.]